MALFLILFSLAAQGGPNPLLEEFLDSHLQLKINALEKSRALIDRDLVRGIKTWNFSGSLGHSETQTSFSGFEISKDFEWGGQLKFDHTRPDDAIGGSRRSFTFAQSLGRNFFGRQFYTNLELARRKVQLSDIILSQKNQIELGKFYQGHLRARWGKTLLELQQRALQRSQERLKVIKKRVRDGLNEKADHYSAQIEHVRKQEELASAQFALEEALDNLSNKLHRHVRAEEVARVALKGESLTRPMDYDIQENLDLRSLKIKLQMLNEELGNLKRNYLPNIVLSGTYREGDMGGTMLGAPGSRDEYVVTLSLKMPLTLGQERLQVARKNVDIVSAEMQRRQILNQLKFSKEILDNEIATRLKNLKFSRRRIELSRKNLKENTRLYSIGRVDFDGLLRAEENLINTERSYFDNWFRYESTIAKKASLYAKLLETIGGTKL